MNPICPKCAGVMKLVRTAPRLGGLPELRTYRCEPCGTAFTEADSCVEEGRAMMLDLEAGPHFGAMH